MGEGLSSTNRFLPTQLPGWHFLPTFGASATCPRMWPSFLTFPSARTSSMAGMPGAAGAVHPLG